MVFIESPETEEEFERIGREIDAPLLANMVEGGFSPVVPAQSLARLGFAIAIYPGTGFLATAKTLEAVYGHLRDERLLHRPEGRELLHPAKSRADGVRRGVGSSNGGGWRRVEPDGDAPAGGLGRTPGAAMNRPSATFGSRATATASAAFPRNGDARAEFESDCGSDIP